MREDFGGEVVLVDFAFRGIFIGQGHAGEVFVHPGSKDSGDGGPYGVLYRILKNE
jgi:hypothetical protein